MPDTNTITLLTTVHPRDDIRIAVKQCATLADAYPGRLELVVADGLGEERRETYPVEDLGHIATSRVARPFRGFARAVGYLRRRRPAIVHFHDPELIPAGLVAKLLGSKVVYDVHEDVPAQLRGRNSLKLPVRHVLAWGAAFAEWLAGRVFDGIVCATPSIARRFPDDNTTLVQNFPIVGELAAVDASPHADRRRRFVYVGGITEQRGAREMLQAISLFDSDADVELALAGPCVPGELEEELLQTPGAAHCSLLGWLDREAVSGLLAASRGGLVLFHDAPNHVSAQPNKLFEYMSAGLPVIASDFPLWRELIEGIGSGLLVDPTDPAAIRDAMVSILDDPATAEEMGRKGRRAVETDLNWAAESRSLLSLYRRLLDRPSSPAG